MDLVSPSRTSVIVELWPFRTITWFWIITRVLVVSLLWNMSRVLVEGRRFDPVLF